MDMLWLGDTTHHTRCPHTWVTVRNTNNKRNKKVMEFKVLGKRVSHADDEKLLMQMTKKLFMQMIGRFRKKKKKEIYHYQYDWFNVYELL
jgi:hypothetical protein